MRSAPPMVPGMPLKKASPAMPASCAARATITSSSAVPARDAMSASTSMSLKPRPSRITTPGTPPSRTIRLEPAPITVTGISAGRLRRKYARSFSSSGMKNACAGPPTRNQVNSASGWLARSRPRNSGMRRLQAADDVGEGHHGVQTLAPSGWIAPAMKAGQQITISSSETAHKEFRRESRSWSAARFASTMPDTETGSRVNNIRNAESDSLAKILPECSGLCCSYQIAASADLSFGLGPMTIEPFASSETRLQPRRELLPKRSRCTDRGRCSSNRRRASASCVGSRRRHHCSSSDEASPKYPRTSCRRSSLAASASLSAIKSCLIHGRHPHSLSKIYGRTTLLTPAPQARPAARRPIA